MSDPPQSLDPRSKNTPLWWFSWQVALGRWLFLTICILTGPVGLSFESRLAQASVQTPAFLATSLILLTPFVFLGYRSRFWSPLWIVFVLSTIADVAASFHFSLLGRFPSLADTVHLSQIHQLTPSIAPLFPMWWSLPAFIIMTLMLIGLHAHAQRLLHSTSEIFSQKKIGSVAVWGGSLLLCLLTLGIRMETHPGSTPPLVALWDSPPPPVMDSPSGDTDQSANVDRLRTQLGIPPGQFDEMYPFCRTDDLNRQPSSPSTSLPPMILLVVESLSSDVIAETFEGQALTPYLQEIVKQHWHHLTLRASGTKSHQALHAIYSSVPSQPAYPLMYREPLNHLPSLPDALSAGAYKTGYLYSGDLAYDHQYEYLTQIGFDDIRGAVPTDEQKIFGWGYSDEEILQRARRWIRNHMGDGSPFFLAVTTTATHHPFTLPPHTKRPFDAVSIAGKRANSWAAFDKALQSFLVWLDDQPFETPPIVFITGDHVDHHRNAQNLKDKVALSYDVPLIIRATPSLHGQMHPQKKHSPAMHADIGPTLLSLAGLPSMPCAWGTSLLSESPRREGRLTYSLSDDRSNLTFWQGHVRGDLNTRDSRFSFRPSGNVTTSLTLSNKERSMFTRFAEDLFKTSVSLVNENRFTPPRKKDRPAVSNTWPEKAELIVAAHRGNTSGPNAPQDENTLDALLKSEEAGFEWAEIDVTPTKDNVIILMHDTDILVQSGERVPVASMTLAELRQFDHGKRLVTLKDALNQTSLNLLVEMKTPTGTERIMAFSRKLTSLLNAHSKNRRFIVDSFTRFAASSMARYCTCETGWDAPQNNHFLSDDWLQWTREGGMKWLYLEFSTLNPELLDRIHDHGLRVMAYTVNDHTKLSEEILGRLDGVITDYARVKDALNQKVQRAH